MSPHVRALIATALLVLVAGSPLELRADSVDDENDAVLALDKAGKDAECVAKIATMKDARAFATLKELAGKSKSDAVAAAAIRHVAVTWKDAEYFRWLVGRLEDKDLAADRPEIFKAVLDAVQAYPPEKIKHALKPLAEVVAKHMASEPDIAARAIRAYGTVPDRFTVQQLLEWLAQAGAAGGGKGGNSKAESKDARANKDAAKKVVLETLTQLTGKDLGDLEPWKKWWDENGKTFKFPLPRKDGAAPVVADPVADPSALTEFKDEGYGYAMKKPQGEDWKFFKPDYQGPRIGLMCLQTGSDSFNLARGYVSVHDPAKYEPRDIKSFAKWAIDVVFKEQFMADEDRPAVISEITVGDTPWTVVTGKGLAAGVKANWGTIERRFYFTPLGSNILYVDAFVRLGSDDELKDALWKSIETMTLPKK